MTRLALNLVAVLALGLSLALDGASAAERRVALVIGNSDYANASHLKNPSNDADDMAAVLGRLGFEVVQGRNLSARGMRALVREFGEKLRGANVALLFYAGHAIQVNGQNYLAPTDAELKHVSDLDFETIPLQFVMRQMEREVDTIVVLLDACRDNPLARSLNATTRSTVAGRGLARELSSGQGTIIAFATQPDNVALDGRGRNSPFTSALLANLERPGVEISTLMTDVRLQVYEATGGLQVPWTNSSLLGRFYFKEGAPAQSAAPAPKSDPNLPSPDAIPKPAERPQDHVTAAALVARANLHASEEDYARAATLYREAAARGEPRAMVAIGNLLSRGLGMPADAAAAHGWYKQAADLGYAEAQFLVGRDYERGTGGVTQDLDLAASWYDRAARGGDADAMNNLAVMRMLGEAGAQDLDEAVAWFQRAAEAGSSDAMFNLGALYDDGKGVAQSPDKAADWVLKSIEAGNPDALLEMKSNYRAWSQAFRRTLQATLHDRKLFSGAVDGEFGSDTLAAIDRLARGY